MQRKGRSLRMSLIHKFEQDGQYYVIDVNSGSFHLVDELIYDMLLDDNKLDINWKQ